MKTKLFQALPALAILTTSFVYGQKVNVSASESDAQIFVNGQPVSSGSYVLKIEKDQCYNVKAVETQLFKV